MAATLDTKSLGDPCWDMGLLLGDAIQKRKRKKLHPDSYEARQDAEECKMAEIAFGLPEDKEALLKVARQAMVDFHESIMDGGNIFATEGAASRYQAVVWKMNGGTFFGCEGGDESPGRVVRRHCAATPGEAPMWGQLGEFLIEVQGVRAFVRYKGRVEYCVADYEFHAIHLDRPFPSETGFRSHCHRACLAQMTVQEAAGLEFAQILQEETKRGKLPTIREEWKKHRTSPWWLTERLVELPPLDPLPPQYVEGDLVLIEWDPTTTKRAQFVRHTKTGGAVVRVEGVDTKSRPNGKWGFPRTFGAKALLGHWDPAAENAARYRKCEDCDSAPCSC